jgi:hypothetical protein
MNTAAAPPTQAFPAVVASAPQALRPHEPFRPSLGRSAP